MMMQDMMDGGMWGMSLGGIILLILVVFGIAALIIRNYAHDAVSASVSPTGQLRPAGKSRLKLDHPL